MNRKEMLDLMQFVCDQNNNALYELIVSEGIELTEQQTRAIMSVLEAKTKNCFMRFVERM